MNIFLRLLNKIRFEKVTSIGKVADSTNEKNEKQKFFEYFEATPRKKGTAGFTLLLDGRVLQKNVEKISASFATKDELKHFSNSSMFATKSEDSRLFDVSGHLLSTLPFNATSAEGNNFEILKVEPSNGSLLQVYDFGRGTSFFINFENNFISEDYSSTEVLEDGTVKVVSKESGKTYFLSKDLLPTTEPLSLDESAPDEVENEIENEAEIEEAFKEQTQTLFGQTIVVKANGEKRFVDENGKNRSFPIDKIIDLQNGTMLIKRNHSSNWDIQRTDNLKFVLKGIKNCIHNNGTHVTFGIFENRPVIFGTDLTKMYTVDESIAKLVLSLLNKTKMSSPLIDEVEENPERMDKTLEAFQAVLKDNFEKDKDNKVLRRLNGKYSLDQRFVNHLLGIYRIREKRESKTITAMEQQIKALEDKISELSGNLETAKDKKGVASESYSSILEIKERLEQKLTELKDSNDEKGDE